ENGQIHTVRVVEGVGQVKHVTTFDDGLQVAVEMFGLDDSELNELIRATNNASLNANGTNVSEEVSDEQEDAHQAALSSEGD
ncbi:MAG: hypothetical protein ACYTE8_06825, partial [Planctomycetota bacterium]